jgi:hypothetical protein
MKAYIRSLKIMGEVGTGLGERHVMDEIDCIEKLEGNHAIVGYRGRRYAALYNPYVGAYFVDDVDGEVD